MAKNVLVTMTIANNSQANNFTVRDNFGNILATNVPKATLATGVTYSVQDTVTSITVDSTGVCTSQDTANIVPITNTYNVYFATSRLCPNCSTFQTNITVSVPTSIPVSVGQHISINDGMAYELTAFQYTGASSGTLLIGGIAYPNCLAICSA